MATTDETNTSTETDSTSTDDTTSTSTDTSSTTTKTTVEEIEIDNYYEALRFAYKYAHMILREDGHEIELKVLGNEKWKMGEWCKIKIPSFNEEGTYFINKISTDLSPTDENIASITLVDYPPSLSSGTSNTASNDSTTDTSTNTTTNEDGSTTTTNSDGSSTTTYTDGSSVTTDSSGNVTTLNGGTNSQAGKSIKMGKNKKMVKASERVKGERYITVISNGKPAGYIHLSKSEASKITEGSAKTKIPVRSSLSKMKKGERYKRVYKNGKLIKLIWVKKSYSGPMHIYL